MLKDSFFHEKPSKHLTVFSPETVNTKILANLTANTSNYRKITNTLHIYANSLTFSIRINRFEKKKLIELTN